jgi:lipopolysaccharide/colanic/teichoic acid biosynthesis glycosyltransferase
MTRTDTARRAFDVICATALVLLTLPVLVLAAIGTTISLRAWPFFTQTRIGRDGEEFRFVKLRTLPVHAPRYAGKYELGHLHLPWFSRTLRMLHLDELPQLLLVVIGRMSLVGPRPEMPYLHEQFRPEFAAARTSVRPGCTGLWQVSEFCDRMIYEHPELDEHYLANRSLRLDLWIIGRTLRLLLPVSDKRLVTLAQLPAWARARSTAPVRDGLDGLAHTVEV